MIHCNPRHGLWGVTRKAGMTTGDVGCGGNLASKGKGNPIADSLESAILCIV